MGEKKIARKIILEKLRKIKPELEAKYGVTKLGVFGSFARDQVTATSDLDVVLEMKQPNLFLAANIKEDLESTLNMTVDLVRFRDRMNPFLKRRIEQEAQYV